MAFTENLSHFFDDFGDDGFLDGQAVRVIYDAPSGTDLGSITTTQPQVQIASASVPSHAYGMVLVVPAGTFTIREVLPDGTGMTLLLLSEA